MPLNFKEFGQGQPIIILHGLFGMLDNWQTIAKKLADHYLVYIVDQRNHGRSPHFPDMNYPLMAQDLQEFMESNWIYHAHILGHSMGGKTAMQFAINFPEYVDKLVVVDIAPKAYTSGHDLIFEALNMVDTSTVTSRSDVQNTLSEKIAEPGVIQFLMKNLSRNKSGGYEWKMNLKAIEAGYPNILAKVNPASPFDKDALFLKGALSNYITNDDTPLIKSLFPKARINTINNAGHWVHADQPLSLYEALTDFLSE